VTPTPRTPARAAATVLIRRWLPAVLLTLAVPASAQIIHGTVTAASTGAPISGAAVSVFLGSSPQATYTVVSDAKGAFDLIVPAGKPVRVRVEHSGFDDASSAPLTLLAGELIDIEVRLSGPAVMLREIEVVGRRPVDWRLKPFLERAAGTGQAGAGHIWTRADLVRQNLPFVSHIVRTVPARAESLCRGTAVYVDDLPLAEEDLDLFVSPGDLEGLEVYRSGEIPADWAARTLVISRDGLLELNPDGLKPCRLVLVWRRPYSENRGRVTLGKVARVVAFAGAVFLVNLLVR